MPPIVLDILKYGFALYLTYDFIRNLRSTHGQRLFKVVFCTNWKKLLLYWLMDIPVLAVVLGTGWFLINLQFLVIPAFGPILRPTPLLNFSWLQLLESKGHPESGGNLMISGAMKVPILGVFFLILLLLNLPRLARYEEDAFRRGTKDWKDGALRSLKFGMAHCLVGIPIGMGLGLGLGGLWFTYHYFKGGVRRSTIVHTLYNVTLVIFLVCLLANEAMHPAAVHK